MAWTLPAVSCQISQLSMVPNASSPRMARWRAPGICCSSQFNFVPEKYASMTRPVFSPIAFSSPARFNASQNSAVRRSCQTIAGAIGKPLARSQSTVVSRWLVMPIAPMSLAAIADLAITSAATRRWVCQISRASCSTQPGRGKCWVNSRCDVARTSPLRLNNSARELVVPWSKARMAFMLCRKEVGYDEFVADSGLSAAVKCASRQ